MAVAYNGPSKIRHMEALMRGRCAGTWALGVALLAFLALPSGCTFQVKYPPEDAFHAEDSLPEDQQVGDQQNDLQTDLAADTLKDDTPEDLAGDLVQDALSDAQDTTDAFDTLHDTGDDSLKPDVPTGECEQDSDCEVLYFAAETCFIWHCVGDPRACVQKPADGASCNDLNECTEGDACMQGQCAGTPVGCPEQPCKSGTCKQGEGCVYEPLSDVPCDDGDVCSGASSCHTGICTGVDWTTCSDNDPCTDDWCDPVSGCQSLVVPGCGQCYLENTGYNVDFGGECCEGLTAIPLCTIDATVCPSQNCVAACQCADIEVICTRCGDGTCGPGENVCNCQADCPLPSQSCASVDGLCTDNACAQGYHEEAYYGCPAAQLCCVQNPTCVPLYGSGTYTSADACCNGVAIPKDVSSTSSSGCSVSAIEFYCSPCGNGHCDQPYETPCNCSDCLACDSFADCPFFKGCVDGICKECGFELCGNGFNEDCDQDTDEQVCASKSCSNPPSNYEPVPLWAVLKNPAFFESKYVAFVGRVVAGETSCVFADCVAQLFAEEQLGGKRILLAPSVNYPEVNCSAQLLDGFDSFDPVDCTPVQPLGIYTFFGRVGDTSTANPKLFLLGFCQ